MYVPNRPMSGCRKYSKVRAMRKALPSAQLTADDSDASTLFSRSFVLCRKSNPVQANRTDVAIRILEKHSIVANPSAAGDSRG